jgi:hypothetical protein
MGPLHTIVTFCFHLLYFFLVFSSQSSQKQNGCTEKNMHLNDERNGGKGLFEFWNSREMTKKTDCGWIKKSCSLAVADWIGIK